MRPFRIDFEITGNCNLRCKYCLAMPFSGFNPPFESLASLFDKTEREVDPFEVVLVGGEPMVHPAFFRIIAEARRIFGAVGLSTNGTLLHRLSRSELDILASTFPRGELQVSLDSVDARANDNVRGASKEVLKGLERLDAAGVPFSVGMVVSKSNVDSIPSSAELLAGKYQTLQRIGLMNLMPSEILGNTYLDLKVPRIDYVRAVEEVRKVCARCGRPDLRIVSDMTNSALTTDLDTAGFTACFAGFTRIDVLPNGDVTPCSMIRSTVVGNAYRESWATILQRSSRRFASLNEGSPKGAQCVFFNSQRTRGSESVARSSPPIDLPMIACP